MYTTFGVLNFPELEDMPTENKKGRQAKFAAESLSAIEIFCKVSSPSQKAFEPRHLIQVTKEQGTLPKDFPLRAEAVRRMVESAHGRSLNQHFLENPLGRLPNRIIFKKHMGPRHARCTLVWNSSGGDLQVTLFLYRYASPSLRIIGWSEALVTKRAALARLPVAKFDKGANLPRIAPLPPSPLVSLHDVKVPIGDLLDFLAKYRR